MKYIPKSLRYSTIYSKMSLSPSSYAIMKFSNKNFKLLGNLIKNKKNGKEVGSRMYTTVSNKFFIRTRAITDKSILLNDDAISIIPIIPDSFINNELKKGMILINKDSNVGEVVYLTDDMSNYMFSSGINCFEISKYQLYVLAFMKTPLFKDQIIVPVGTTIKHGKDNYLKCKIPFPRNLKNIIFIEKLMDAWIKREQKILFKYNKIENFLKSKFNHESSKFAFKPIRYSNVCENDYRLDSGMSTLEYTKIIHKLKNSDMELFYLDPSNLHSGKTPSIRMMRNGKNWITPSSLDKKGYYLHDEKIHCEKYNINEPVTLLVNRTGDEQLDNNNVCLAIFYDTNRYGIAQCNQGFYIVSGHDEKTLKTIAILFNSQIYKRLFKLISSGAVLREIKIKDIYKIPFFKFNKNDQNKLIKHYTNNNIHKNYEMLNISNIDKIDKKYLNGLGIIELADQITCIRKFLLMQFENIINNEKYDLPQKISLNILDFIKNFPKQ